MVQGLSGLRSFWTSTFQPRSGLGDGLWFPETSSKSQWSLRSIRNPNAVPRGCVASSGNSGTMLEQMNCTRRFYETHHGDSSPLLVIRHFVESHGLPDPAQVSQISREVALPEAAVRGAISYYSDLHEDPDATRVCLGTSCVLAGAKELFSAASERTACRPVYCIGFCDRSPAALRSDDRAVALNGTASVEPLLDPASPEPSRPAIRSVAKQTIVTRRMGRGDFSDLNSACADGAYETLAKVRRMKPEDILSTMEQSGERGRGGAAFPTGTKWRRCAEAASDLKYVVANGDEGDPGSFIDRVLMEDDPHAILEGMAICGHAVGAQKGIVYIRSEYPRAMQRVKRAIETATAAGLLHDFDVSVFPGMGSYVCGEETAMLNAIEGLRGEVRLRPPYPVVEGLFGKPTVVNNAETLVNVPWILERGAKAYAALGTKASPGTKVMCLNHGFAFPGILEVEFGRSLREVIEFDAGGGAHGQKLQAILIGGPMGSVALPKQWDVPVCYQAMAERNLILGHAGLVAVPEGADMRALFLHWLEFMADESCGKCVPCRLGSRRALDLAHGAASRNVLPELSRLMDIMAQGSLCAFGQLMPGPMSQMLEYFGDRIFP
jgi:NADH:ubiquinone oxidoreductase subunit F (NADH-binding)/NADH:ubiquinone oxidoreductase subunit E